MRTARIFVMLLVAAIGTSSCTALKDGAADLVEHAIEEAIAGLDLADGIPAGFPEDDVPVVEGKVRGASRTTSEGTEHVVLVEAPDAGQKAATLLEDAGLTQVHAVSSGSGQLAEYRDEQQDISATLIASGTRVVYVVRTGA